MSVNKISPSHDGLAKEEEQNAATSDSMNLTKDIASTLFVPVAEAKLQGVIVSERK